MGNLEKIILDACCGGKMFWYDKHNPHVLFMDKRVRPKGFMRVSPSFEVAPDVVGDFRSMDFKDCSFKMVVFDPPHTIRTKEESGIISERYGRLKKETWEDDLRRGFRECWRVLEPFGVLTFKWSEVELKLKDIQHLYPAEPLFGSRVGARGDTVWLCFMKFSDQPSS